MRCSWTAGPAGSPRCRSYLPPGLHKHSSTARRGGLDLRIEPPRYADRADHSQLPDIVPSALPQHHPIAPSDPGRPVAHKAHQADPPDPLSDPLLPVDCPLVRAVALAVLVGEGDGPARRRGLQRRVGVEGGLGLDGQVVVVVVS